MLANLTVDPFGDPPRPSARDAKRYGHQWPLTRTNRHSTPGSPYQRKDVA